MKNIFIFTSNYFKKVCGKYILYAGVNLFILMTCFCMSFEAISSDSELAIFSKGKNVSGRVLDGMVVCNALLISNISHTGFYIRTNFLVGTNGSYYLHGKNKYAHKIRVRFELSDDTKIEVENNAMKILNTSKIVKLNIVTDGVQDISPDIYPITIGSTIIR